MPLSLRTVSDLLKSTNQAGKALGWLCLMAGLSLATMAQNTVPRPPNADKGTPTAVPHPPEKVVPLAEAEDANSTIRVNV